VIEVNKCLSIKGAEDRVNKAHAFEISTIEESMFFIADSDKVRQAKWTSMTCDETQCSQSSDPEAPDSS
jgi:hypothetical protein